MSTSIIEEFVNLIRKLKLTDKEGIQQTGIDITMQKDGSRFLNINGLKNLSKNNSKKYLEIKSIYLTKKWHQSPIEVQLIEIAHNIRTRYKNKKRKQNKLFNKSIYQFDLFTNSYNHIISNHYGIN